MEPWAPCTPPHNVAPFQKSRVEGESVVNERRQAPSRRGMARESESESSGEEGLAIKVVESSRCCAGVS